MSRFGRFFNQKYEYELFYLWSTLVRERLFNLGLLFQHDNSFDMRYNSLLEACRFAIYTTVWQEIENRTLASPPGRVLEVGCGQGFGLQHLAGFAPGVEFAGVDTSWLGCQLTRARGFAARRANMTGLPFPDRHFNAVLSVEAMLVFEDAVASLREARRVLAPGGCIVVATFFNRPVQVAAAQIAEQARQSGLAVANLVDVTRQAIDCIRSTQADRIRNLARVPALIRRHMIDEASIREMSALAGTTHYAQWDRGERSYFIIALTHPDDDRA